MRYMIFFLAGILALSLVSCSGGHDQINGAGATFPYVIYSKWFDLYHQKTGVAINYQSLGSGTGIKQVIEGTVDFGASDGPMSPEQLDQAMERQGTQVLHIPTVLGAVVLSYNVPGVDIGLKLSSDAVAKIFLGEVTKWNDPLIAAANPGVKLPNLAIIVAHRSDGSGTSFIFTDYLSKISPVWESKVGRGTSVSFPIGLGAKGNEGVSGLLKQTPNSIGYIELAYAIKNNLPYAALQNNAGQFVLPTLESVTAAAAGTISTMPNDLRVSITNADGAESYPVSGFTWLLIYQNPKDKKKAKMLVDFLNWAMEEGQTYAKELYYAPLPPEIILMCKQKIASINTAD